MHLLHGTNLRCSPIVRSSKPTTKTAIPRKGGKLWLKHRRRHRSNSDDAGVFWMTAVCRHYLFRFVSKIA